MPRHRRRSSSVDYTDLKRSRERRNDKIFMRSFNEDRRYDVDGRSRSLSRSRYVYSRARQSTYKRSCRSSTRSSSYRYNNRHRNGDSDYSSGIYSRNYSRCDYSRVRHRKRRHSSGSTGFTNDKSIKRRRSSRDFSDKRHFESDVSDVNDFESYDEGSYSEHDNRGKSEYIVEDDKEGHLVMTPGQVIRRFKVENVLGEGTFGRVVRCQELRCRDDQTDETQLCSNVALKVIKNISKYRDAARYEINVLRVLKERDPLRRFNCVRSLGWFNYHGHICIVFEMLGLSIFDFLEKNEYSPYPLDHVQIMAYQLISAVNFLHANKITHTDLKPENILLVNDSFDLKYCPKLGHSKKILRRPDIRLIDFGSATFEHEHHTTIVSTRHYRAPEVILELGWSYPCDVWSIGCILFEIFTGIALFMTHDNLEHLAMMERALSRRIPSRMIRHTRKRKYFYHGRLDWDPHCDDGRYVRHNVRPLSYHFHQSSRVERRLLNLIENLLNYSPKERATLNEALKHSFFDCFHQCYFSESRPPWYRDSSSGNSQRRSYSGTKHQHYSRTLSSRS